MGVGGLRHSELNFIGKKVVWEESCARKQGVQRYLYVNGALYLFTRFFFARFLARFFCLHGFFSGGLDSVALMANESAINLIFLDLGVEAE
jgi:hypothetical protein